MGLRAEAGVQEGTFPDRGHIVVVADRQKQGIHMLGVQAQADRGTGDSWNHHTLVGNLTWTCWSGHST
uniref:Uncharacterized protein n=1 Tax=Anguilla anguilla TaxID=7936 RepID=A0A0E9RBU1_ANGAN